ncbi:MAG: hypothetical protein IKU37_01295 [Candidatus Gastranaerophilales bacterium]|nr:hypothetical protein [Candidatus Gastranaerophilales bacterium]
MDNETRISLSFKNDVTGDEKLKEYEKRLKTIYSMLDAFNTGKAKNISLVEKETKQLGNTTANVAKSNDKMAKQFDSMFKTGGLFLYTRQLSKLIKTMASATQLSVDYVENTNLLEVAYARTANSTEDYNQAVEESSKKVKGLIDQMSKVYGFDENRLTRSFGIFKQMANAMKLPDETAENLSEHLVKMSNDIASLYNLDLKRAENALQSALAG